MRKMTSQPNPEGLFERTISFHMTKAQLMVATVTLILMLSAAIIKSVWGMSAIASQVDASNIRIEKMESDIKVLNLEATSNAKLIQNISDLTDTIKELKDEVSSMRNDWEDLWKNYNIPRRR